MLYNIEDYVMATFCMYAYEDSDTVSKEIFGKGLTFGGKTWTFNKNNFFYNKLKDTACYVFITNDNTDVAIVFRGTNSIENWLMDFNNISYTAWPSTVTGSKIGTGWLKAWQSLSEDVMDFLDTLLLPANPHIIVTGHSLGASMATIAAVDIQQKIISKYPGGKVRLVNFASPLVGNGIFSSYFCGNESGDLNIDSYLLYRDPNDLLIWLNTLMASQIFSDPFVDLVNVAQTVPGYGHSIINYVECLNPGECAYDGFTLNPRSRSGAALTAKTLNPTDEIDSLIIAVAGDPNLVVNSSIPAPPIMITLIAGIKSDGSGGVPLTLYKEGMPYFSPDKMNYVLFSTSDLQGLQVSDLQNCKMVMTMTCNVDEGCCNIDMTNPLVFSGLQVIVNGSVIFTDLTMGISLTMDNPDFLLSIKTPHYNIVGGRMQATDSTSKEPYIDVIEWGEKTDLEIGISNQWCYTPQYGSTSYGYTSVYVKSAELAVGSNGQQVIGGWMEVTNATSTAEYIQTIFWGESSDYKQLTSSAYCYTDVYGADSYCYSGVYLSPPGAAPTNLPRVIGGRMQVTDATSGAPFIETYFWGERSAYESYASNAWCYTEVYGAQSYSYVSVYTDRPVDTVYNNAIKYQISLNSICCVAPQEYGEFDNTDEIFIKYNGTKVWPEAPYYSISRGTTAPVNQVFEIDSITSAAWELWEVDAFFDDQLYEFLFTNLTMAYDPSSDFYVSLQDCTPGKTYRIFGRKVDGENYAYYLNIQVQKIE